METHSKRLLQVPLHGPVVLGGKHYGRRDLKISRKKMACSELKSPCLAL